MVRTRARLLVSPSWRKPFVGIASGRAFMASAMPPAEQCCCGCSLPQGVKDCARAGVCRRSKRGGGGRKKRPVLPRRRLAQNLGPDSASQGSELGETWFEAGGRATDRPSLFLLGSKLRDKRPTTQNTTDIRSMRRNVSSRTWPPCSGGTSQSATPGEQ